MFSAAPLRSDRAAFERLQKALQTRAAPVLPTLATGWEDLDRALGGGFPCGALAIVEGSASSGRWALLARLLARGTANGLAAVIDHGECHPPSLKAAGVQLERLLIVLADEPLQIAKAADIVLRSGAFSVLVMPAVALKPALWTRITQLAQRSNAVAVAVGTQTPPQAAGCAATALGCCIDRLWTVGTGLWTALSGYDFDIAVRKCRRGMLGAHVRLHASSFEPLPSFLHEEAIQIAPGTHSEAAPRIAAVR